MMSINRIQDLWNHSVGIHKLFINIKMCYNVKTWRIWEKLGVLMIYSSCIVPSQVDIARNCIYLSQMGPFS